MERRKIDGKEGHLEVTDMVSDLGLVNNAAWEACF
jgi:hypothetical protein